MIEIAGGILLALIAIVLVIAILPYILWGLIIAIWALVALAIVGALWYGIGLTTVFVVAGILCVGLLYWLGEPDAQAP